MSFWNRKKDDREIRVEEEILEVQKEELRELRKIEHDLHPHRTNNIVLRFTGANTMNSVVLNVGQSTIASITPLEADDSTITPGAVVSAQSYSISDPSLTITPNDDGTATIAGVAAGGVVNGTASATVTEQDGTVKNFTQGFTVQVNAPAPPPTNRTANIGVSFTTPA